MTANEQNGNAPRVFVTREKLRNGDTDQQGHINNAKIATFFEAGRMEVLGDKDAAAVADVTNFVVVRLEIDFKRELFFPGYVDVHSQVVRVGNTSFKFEQKLFAEGEEVASGTSTCVLIDKATRKPVSVPGELREFFGVAG